MLDVKAMAMLGSLITLLIRVIVAAMLQRLQTTERLCLDNLDFHIEYVFIPMEQQFAAAMWGGVMGY